MDFEASTRRVADAIDGAASHAPAILAALRVRVRVRVSCCCTPAAQRTAGRRGEKGRVMERGCVRG